MAEKILTISVAAYNVEKFLNKTLSSLVCCEELFEKLEVLVIDDGSTDNSAEIAFEYEKKYPNVFRVIQKENGGHGSTLNTSVRKATGNYFKMLDGDDWFETSEFEKLLLYLSGTQADIILSPYKQVYETGQHDKDIDRHNMEIEQVYEISSNQLNWLEDVHAAEMTVKTELLKANKFCILENCAYTDDEYVFNAILCARSYIKLSCSVYRYRMGIDGQTVSETGRKKHWLDGERVTIAMLITLTNHNNKIINERHIQVLYHFIKRTADMQCLNYVFAQDTLQLEDEFTAWMNKIKEENKDFETYLTRSMGNYGWWKWLFGLYEEVKNQNCIIFGAGDYGKRVEKYLHDREVQLMFFCDNNNLLWGEKCDGYRIVNPQNIFDEYNNCKIIIAIKNHAEQIEEQLLSMGVSPDRIIVFRK